MSISRSRLTLSYHLPGHSDSDRHGVLASPRSALSLSLLRFWIVMRVHCYTRTASHAASLAAPR